MKDTTKKALDSVLKQHAAQKKEVAENQAVYQKKVDEVQERFKTVRASVIRPVLESVGEHLKSAGHEYKISEGARDEGYSTDSRQRITFTLFIDGKQAGRAEEYPNFAFILDREKVGMYQSTIGPGRGGSGGSIGDVRVDDITPELVEEKLLAFVQKLFGGGF
jgi:hypothetical protein